MTNTTLTATMAGSAVGSDESAVAVTLCWPPGTYDSLSGFSTGGSHIIELIGDVDAILASRVRGLLATLAAHSSELAIDVSGVQFIDSAGLDLLGLLHRKATASGGQMSLIGVGPQVRRALGVAELEHLLSDDS